MLINITGGQDLLFTKSARLQASFMMRPIPEANIIFGAVLDERMKGEVKITVIATGFDKRPESVMTAAAAAGAGLKPSISGSDLEIPAFLRRAQK